MDVLSRSVYTHRQFLREMGVEPNEESFRQLEQWRRGERLPRDPDHISGLARVLDGSEEELRTLVEYERTQKQLEALEERHEDSTDYIEFQRQDGSVEVEEIGDGLSSDELWIT